MKFSRNLLAKATEKIQVSQKTRFYALLRPLLFCMEPEAAHAFTFKLLKKGLVPKAKPIFDKSLGIKVCGIEFANPIGLAAGFDKNAEIISETQRLGFGFVEVGSITPQPQPGNPQPRIFRIPKAQAIINRLGFNSLGINACLGEIVAWHDSHLQTDRGVLGINLGKNKASADAAADYISGYRVFAPYANYMTINISSPNTPGLRDLQEDEALSELLQKITMARSQSVKKPPIFIKIAPDLTQQQQEGIAATLLTSGIDGLIVGNTTTSRPASIPANMAKEAGGLSGKPLFALSTQVLANMYRLTEGKLPIIGCGGVFSAEDAYAKIGAGASLIQIYTALIYEGPGLVNRINRGLAALMRRDGFASVSAAVGKDIRR